MTAVGHILKPGGSIVIGFCLFFIMLAALASTAAVWSLFIVVKKGVNEHIKSMQGIYDEISRANRPATPGSSCP